MAFIDNINPPGKKMVTVLLSISMLLAAIAVLITDIPKVVIVTSCTVADICLLYLVGWTIYRKEVRNNFQSVLILLVGLIASTLIAVIY